MCMVWLHWCMLQLLVMQLLSSFSCNMYVFLLWLPCVADAYIIFLSCFFFFSIFHCLISVSQIGYLPYFYTWCGCSANLECRSEMCCKRLAGNAGPKKPHKIHHLGTIAQLCRTISSQLRHISTIGKKLVKQQYLPHMSYNMVNFGPLAAVIVSLVWGTRSKFQRVSCLGIITARHSSIGISHTLRRLTEGATYIRQGGHHVGHWPTFYCSSDSFHFPCVQIAIFFNHPVLLHSVSVCIKPTYT